MTRQEDGDVLAIADEHHDEGATEVAGFSFMPTTQTTTVTTTTTVATTFPPIVFKKPRRQLTGLDPAQYPLRMSSTPAALRNFTFEVDGRQASFEESGDADTAMIRLQAQVDELREHNGAVQDVKKSSTAATQSRATSTAHVPDHQRTASDSRKRPPPVVELQRSTGYKRRVVSDSRAISSPFVPAGQPTHTDTANSLERDERDGAGPGENSVRNHRRGAEVPRSTTRGTVTEPASTRSNDVTSPMSLSLPSPSASPLGAARAIDEQIGDRVPPARLSRALTDFRQAAGMMEIPAMLDSFDDLPSNVQSYLIYHMLKRCSKPTLQLVASVVNPALKRDFLDLLPYELSMHVLSYLDVRSLCRAAQVSRRWREIVDEDEFTWKSRFERDEYVMADGEFEQAIAEGWGITAHGKQQMRNRRLSTLEDVSARGLPASAVPGTPYLGSRSASKTFAKEHFEEMVNGGLKQPLVGQYIYKAIYKRHHVRYMAWMEPKHKPKHLSFESHGRFVVTCLYHDDEKVITASEDSTIQIFDIRTGALIMGLDGHDGGVWAMKVVGDILVSGSTDRTVRIWNLNTGRCLQVFEGHTSTVRCLAVLPAVKPESMAAAGPGAEGAATADDPDAHIIVTGSRDSTLRIWRLPKIDDPPMPNIGSPSSVQSPNLDGGATGNATRSRAATREAEQRNPYHIRTLQGHSLSVRAIAADGDTLVSGSYDCSVRVWRISTGASIHRLNGHGSKVYSVVLDAKRRRCISGSMDWKVKVWDLELGSCLWTLEGHSSLVGLLAMSHDLLVSAAADSSLRVWDPRTGACTRALTAHTGAITCFQHDADKVISGSDGTLKLWDMKTGKFSRDLLQGLNSVWAVKFDARRCVAAVQRNIGQQLLTYIEVLDFGTGETVSIPTSAGGQTSQSVPAAS